MRVLALDTTTRRGSVALVEDDVIVDERPGDPARSHAERLPGELLALIDARGLPLDAVDLFVVAAGPGSFTGLRIGIATVQGLAFVGCRPIVAVSTLDALAQATSAETPPGTIVGAWVDAQRGEVFSALYRTTAAELFSPERLIVLEPPSVGTSDTTLTRWRGRAALEDVWFAGDGAVRFADAIRRSVREGHAPFIFNPPALAGTLGRIGLTRARRGDTVGPAGVRPEYIRRPDAEIDRDKRAAAAPHR